MARRLAIAQANRELADGTESAQTIQEVEIVELYADAAIEAAHAVKRLAPLIGKELDTDIAATPLLQRGREGRRRLTSTVGRDAWRRWEVSVVTPTRKSEAACLSKPLAERLKHYLRDRQMLLVLDNFEHVLAAASQVAGLLAAAPHLTILATSRAALHLSGEHEYVVPPLALPPRATPR